jgi:hypothetical protein
MLGQDYLLKQFTASLMNPDKELGEKFWKKVKNEVYSKYGIKDIDVSNFSKVWIVPDKAVIYEHNTSAFVVDSHLKVMLEEDLKAMNGQPSAVDGQSADISAIIKATVIPAIEKEVNEGKTFANLRQIYNSMILAVWYKMNLKESLLSKVFVDQNKTKGVNHQDPKMADELYQKYLILFFDDF